MNENQIHNRVQNIGETLRRMVNAEKKLTRLREERKKLEKYRAGYTNITVLSGGDGLYFDLPNEWLLKLVENEIRDLECLAHGAEKVLNSIDQTLEKEGINVTYRS